MHSTKNSIRRITRLSCAVILATSGLAPAASVIALDPLDNSLSTPSAFNGDIDLIVNDPFSYDPLDPTSALPEQGFTGLVGTSNGYHASIRGDAVLTVDFIGGAPTLGQGDVIAFDLYGRVGCCFDRDDNLDIELYYAEGASSLGSLVTTLSTLSISDDEPVWVRAYYAPAPGDSPIDRIRIVAHDSNGRNDNNFFTLLEIRAAVVPEPSTGLLALAGIIGIAMQRTRFSENKTRSRSA